MAYNQVDYLKKVALEGFGIIEEYHGQGRGSQQKQTPPPGGWPQDQYHHYHQKPEAPNLYGCKEPDQQSYNVAAKEPAAFRTYRPLPTKQCYETWYFIPVPQAPKQQGAFISSTQAAENYGGVLFKDHGYKTKPYRWGYNYDYHY